MFYILFTATLPAGQSSLSEQYYSTLQPILHNNKGFIKETPFSDPTEPGAQLLFGHFVDENSMKRWRNNPTHLKIMHQARHHMFSHFRVTVGTDDTPEPSSAATKEGEERVVVVYERPATQELRPEHTQLSYVTKIEVSERTVDSKFYMGEDSWVWVSRLKIGSSADEFEALLERVSGDAVYRIHVIRDYTNDDRKEAPRGIDEAEAVAGARE